MRAVLKSLVGSLALMLASASLAQSFDVADTREFLDAVAESVQRGRVDAHWTDDGKFWFLTPDDQMGSTLILVDPAQPDNRKTLTDTGALAGRFSRHGLTVSDSLDIVDLESAGRRVLVRADAQHYWVSLTGNAAPQLADEIAVPLSPGIALDLFPVQYQQREELAPDKHGLLSLDGNNAVIRFASRQVTALTTTGSQTAPWLFGGDILKPHGSEWSPDAKFVALRHYDMRGVDPWPIVRWLDPIPSVQGFRYFGKAGRPLPSVTVAAASADGSGLTRMQASGGPDDYVAFLEWSPDSRNLWFFRASRDYRRLELRIGSAGTGSVRTVLTETRKDGGYIEFPYNGLRSLRLLQDGKHFLWASDRNGWTHWYLYNVSGRELRQVTDGAFDFGNIVWLAEDGSEMLVEARSDATRPYDTHIWRVPLGKANGAHQLTRLPGQHSIESSPDGRWLLDYHHAPERVPRTDLLTATGQFVATVTEAEVDTEVHQRWSEPELFTAKAADGETDVHGMIIKPAGFSPQRRYPVIERIYGGMQSRVISRGFFAEGARYPGAEYKLMLARMADQGFIVVLMDTPGTPGRGRAFNMATAGTWPEGVIADHVSVLRQLAEDRPWMDMSHLCIEGNSWGGYMAIRALLEAPEVYRCAAASVPETSFDDHAAWIEIPLGTPTDNPPAYAAGNLLDKLDKLQGELLIIAGTSDGNVGFSSNAKLLDALAEAGKPYDYVLFPQTNHAHQGRGDRYAYAVTRIITFFQQTLGTPHTPANP